MRRTKARRTSARRASKPHAAWLRSWRMWATIGWLGTFAAAAYGLSRLEPYVRAINTAPTTIEWVGVPDWLHDENWKHLLPRLEALVDLDPRTDPYDDRVCSWVAERLTGSAWIERVRRVTKRLDGPVRIHAEFRKPFAMVERGGTAYLVDEAGVRLPEQWAAASLNRAVWLVIRGVANPVPSPGRRWGGDDLAAGLKLARSLYGWEAAGRAPFREAIRAIDVGNFRGQKDPRAGRLQLVTINRRSYIHWGLPPEEEYGIESSAELKRAMLCKLYEIDGRLPDKGPIDVRAHDSIALGDPD